MWANFRMICRERTCDNDSTSLVLTMIRAKRRGGELASCSLKPVGLIFVNGNSPSCFSRLRISVRFPRYPDRDQNKCDGGGATCDPDDE